MKKIQSAYVACLAILFGTAILTEALARVTLPGSQTFGPTYPEVGKPYELTTEDTTTLPGQDKGALVQEVRNVFFVQFEVVDKAAETEEISLKGWISWREHKVSTTVNGTKAEPDIQKWDDEEHKTSFEVLCGDANRIKSLKTQSKLPEFEAGIVVYLSSTLFPEFAAQPDGSILLSDPLTRRTYQQISDGEKVPVELKDGEARSNAKDANGKTSLHMKLKTLNGLISVEKIEAVRITKLGDTVTQRKVKVALVGEK